jgi:hypothetical protein
MLVNQSGHGDVRGIEPGRYLLDRQFDEGVQFQESMFERKQR